MESAKYDYQCSQTEKNNVQKSYDDKVDEIKKVQGQLHQMKEEMVHWELILSEVNALYNKIKNASLMKSSRCKPNLYSFSNYEEIHSIYSDHKLLWL